MLMLRRRLVRWLVMRLRRRLLLMRYLLLLLRSHAVSCWRSMGRSTWHLLLLLRLLLAMRLRLHVLHRRHARRRLLLLLLRTHRTHGHLGRRCEPLVSRVHRLPVLRRRNHLVRRWLHGVLPRLRRHPWLLLLLLLSLWMWHLLRWRLLLLLRRHLLLWWT